MKGGEFSIISWREGGLVFFVLIFGGVVCLGERECALVDRQAERLVDRWMYTMTGGRTHRYVDG